MSVYRIPQRDALERFLRDRGLPLPDRADALTDGVSHSNLRLTIDGQHFVLTLYEGLTPEAVQDFLGLQAALHAHGFPCPAIIPSSTGALYSDLGGGPAALFAFVEDDGLSLPTAASVGDLLARLHRCVDEQGISIDRDNPRGAAWMARTAEALRPRLAVEDRQLLDDELDFLARHRSLTLPSGIVHGDVFADNLRVVGGSIRALIDFEFAGREVLLFDVAVAINAFCSLEDGRLDRLAMRDLIAAYAERRPLTQQEHLALPMMLRATALRFWLSRLEEALTPAEGQQVLRKPAEAFRRILLARRAPLSGMQ